MVPEDVLQYWFGEAVRSPEEAKRRASMWFAATPAVDEEMRARFTDTHRWASKGKLDTWAQTPRGRLALVVLLDQFSRNLHRGSSRAFENDSKALGYARDALDAKEDLQLAPLERAFLYLPFEHSENLFDQERAVSLFEALEKEGGEGFHPFTEYSRRHCEIIRRFGRFPHRNAALGRTSTAEELRFLEQPNSSF